MKSIMFASSRFDALPDVHRKGIVGVFIDNVGEISQSRGIADLGWFLHLVSFVKTLPIKYSGIHYCVNTETGNAAINKAIIGILVSAFPRYATARTQLHYGSSMETRYTLRSYGIQMETFPIDSDGTFGKIS